jgi:hypothetical protein
MKNNPGLIERIAEAIEQDYAFKTTGKTMIKEGGFEDAFGSGSYKNFQRLYGIILKNGYDMVSYDIAPFEGANYLIAFRKSKTGTGRNFRGSRILKEIFPDVQNQDGYWISCVRSVIGNEDALISPHTNKILRERLRQYGWDYQIQEYAHNARLPGGEVVNFPEATRQIIKDLDLDINV